MARALAPSALLFTAGALAASTLGCSSAHEADDAGALDSAALDTGMEPPDATGVDAPAVDSGPPTGDADRDGIATALDCNDADPAIGRTSSRECSSACAVGIEPCVDGVWMPCNATSDCACDRPGASRTVDCARCGIASQTCGADLRWSMPGECLDQGECEAGTTERDTARCGDRIRICDAECAWRPWEVRAEPGECDAGQTRFSSTACDMGRSRAESCNVTCGWEATGECAYHCERPPASSRTGADPLCVPQGPFLLGSALSPRWGPERRVVLDEFYVDRDPVTRSRYQACVDAGVCGLPLGRGGELFPTLAPDQFVQGVRHVDAVAFCEWDGGALIDEFQWAKAARGPWPENRRHTWGSGDPDTCDYHPTEDCLEWPFTPDSFPLAVSPYGMHLAGVVDERTGSTWTDDFSWIVDGAANPVPPEGSEQTSRRGVMWMEPTLMRPLSGSQASVAERIARGASGNPDLFRCAY